MLTEIIGMRLIAGIILWTVGVSSLALVFPIPPGASGAYDVQRNALSSFQSAWTNRHAILNFHGANAVAIAPRWFITADHLVGSKLRQG